MNHDGSVLLPVCTNVREIEALGQVVVYLNGSELPLAANHIANHEVDFGAVECRFAGLLSERDAQ